MSVAELLLPFIPVNPVTYTRLAAIDCNFYRVFTQNKLWARFNVYNLPENHDENNIFKHFITSILSSNPLYTASAASYMRFLWDPEHYPRQPPPIPGYHNLYALLGRWRPGFQIFYDSLEYPLYPVTKHFVLCAINLNGLVPFAFEVGMPLTLYSDTDVFNAAIEYCGCNFKPFKSLRGDYTAIERALNRGCRHKQGCFENPFIYVDWHKLPEKLLSLAIKTGLVSVFEVPATEELWRVYLEHQWKFKTKALLYDVQFDCIEGQDLIFRVSPNTFRINLGPQSVLVRVARGDQSALQRLAQIAPLLDWSFTGGSFTGGSFTGGSLEPLPSDAARPLASTRPTVPAPPDRYMVLPATIPISSATVANETVEHHSNTQASYPYKDPSLHFSFLNAALLLCVPAALLIFYCKLHFSIYTVISFT